MNRSWFVSCLTWHLLPLECWFVIPYCSDEYWHKFPSNQLPVGWLGCSPHMAFSLFRVFCYLLQYLFGIDAVRLAFHCSLLVSGPTQAEYLFKSPNRWPLYFPTSKGFPLLSCDFPSLLFLLVHLSVPSIDRPSIAGFPPKLFPFFSCVRLNNGCATLQVLLDFTN